MDSFNRGYLDSKAGTGEWLNENILSVEQFGPESVKRVICLADEMKAMVKAQGSSELLHGKVLANVFFEPSTRTSCSFQAAMLRLGGRVISINETSSSAKKGETLADTMRCMECYTDVVVLRHPEKGSCAIAAKATTKPLLNAGDGVGEHPTQALLDLYTICNELKCSTPKGKTITMVGDLKHGRTVHSLARLLALFDVNINYVSPESLKIPQYIFDELHERGVKQTVTADLESVLPETDILYVTRIQKERFDSQEHYDSVKGSYCITPSTLNHAKSTLVIMHPLPRVGEISEEVDSDPRAAYFRQMENGMYVRMALLALVLGKA